MTNKASCAIIKIQREAQTSKRKELKTMRTIRYYIINKETGKAIYTDCCESKCKAFLATLANKENFAIGYKWLSI